MNISKPWERWNVLWTDTLKCNLTDEINSALAECTDEELECASELRVRPAGAWLCGSHGARKLCGVGADGMRRTICALTKGRLHMLGECMRQGYLPLPGGMRAGICGRAILHEDCVAGLDDISGVCIRIARDVEGAAAHVMDNIVRGGIPRSALVLSAPGLGKTTLLRDAARSMVRMGFNVAVADERGELAGPGKDMLPGADVMSMCKKADAMSMFVRAMRPDVIVTDELGAPGDALAAADALRCGTAVIASAHARTLAHAAARRELGDALRAGVFERVIIISGPRPGEGISVLDGRGNSLC